MIALLTSCNRLDLLQKTIQSFYKNQRSAVRIFIHEDAVGIKGGAAVYSSVSNVFFTNGMGQHKSIEHFLNQNDAFTMFGLKKYYLHLEDDFEFTNTFDWIQASIDIMEADPTIIKVLAREDSQHPCVHDREINGVKYGILQANWHHVGITWQGFSWNPGVTRMDLLKNFIPFRKWEQDVAEDIAAAGYKVAELQNKVYRHIGDGRSTHE